MASTAGTARRGEQGTGSAPLPRRARAKVGAESVSGLVQQQKKDQGKKSPTTAHDPIVPTLPASHQPDAPYCAGALPGGSVHVPRVWNATPPTSYEPTAAAAACCNGGRRGPPSTWPSARPKGAPHPPSSSIGGPPPPRPAVTADKQRPPSSSSSAGSSSDASKSRSGGGGLRSPADHRAGEGPATGSDGRRDGRSYGGLPPPPPPQSAPPAPSCLYMGADDGGKPSRERTEGSLGLGAYACGEKGDDKSGGRRDSKTPLDATGSTLTVVSEAGIGRGTPPPPSPSPDRSLGGGTHRNAGKRASGNDDAEEGVTGDGDRWGDSGGSGR